MSSPNIIVVYCDQQRYDTLGANGNALIQTPNLDAFAATGLNVRRGYVNCPICVPSRISLHTGRYARSTRRYNNATLMPADEVTMPAHFRAAGYRTALLGKDHCFTADQHDANWDVIRIADHCSINDPSEPSADAVRQARRGTMQAPFAVDPIPPEDNITGVVSRWARDFLTEHAARRESQPFFIWLSIPDPHPPYMVCEPYASMYDDVIIPPPATRPGEHADKPYRQQLIAEWNRVGIEYPGSEIDTLRRLYWGMVSYIDDEFGKLRDSLAALGLEDDTIVLYTADHGDYMGDHQMIRKGPHLYDALTHVPMIWRWGSRFPAGPSDAFMLNIDIFPTLCELCGLDTPRLVQGVSQAPVLLGQADSVRDAVYLEHGDPGQPLQPGDLSRAEYDALKHNTGHHLCPEISRGRSRAVVWSHWKYIYTVGDLDELYDLDADPDELTNLAASAPHTDIVRHGRDLLLHWSLATEDRNPLNER